MLTQGRLVCYEQRSQQASLQIVTLYQAKSIVVAFGVPLFSWGKYMRLARNSYLGREIRGYHIIKQLASNGLSYVYLAHNSANQFVVVKIFVAVNMPLRQEQETFLQEAQFLASLEQPRLLPIVEFGVEKGHPFLIMPYVSEGSLRQRMKQPRLLPLAECVELIAKIGAALAALHKKNILHCDLKPENILFVTKEDITLSDPSLASILERVADKQTLRELGTYFAPEQMSGNVTAKSDQYALGCIAYELLTGKLPPIQHGLGESSGQMIRAFVAPSRLNPALPEQIDRVLFKAMAVRPENRYENMAQFVQALRMASPLVQKQRSVVTKKLAAIDISLFHSTPDAATEPEQKAAENGKLVRAFPIISVHKNRHRFPSSLWIMLLMLAALLLVVIALSPALRGRQPQLSKRATPTLFTTKIASNPVVTVTPRATSTPRPRITATVQPLPPLAPRQVPTATPTQPPVVQAQVTGMVQPPPFAVNLTSEGTLDWAQWGMGGANQPNRKAGVTPQISDYNVVGNSPYNNYGNDDVHFSWYDGTPNQIVQNATSGVATYNSGGGFQITVPAQRTMQILRVYTSVGFAQCHFSAILSGNQPAQFNDSSITSAGSMVDSVYTVSFRAADDNQTLTVTLLAVNNVNAGVITIQAATLR